VPPSRANAPGPSSNTRQTNPAINFRMGHGSNLFNTLPARGCSTILYPAVVPPGLSHGREFGTCPRFCDSLFGIWLERLAGGSKYCRATPVIPDNTGPITGATAVAALRKPATVSKTKALELPLLLHLLPVALPNLLISDAFFKHPSKNFIFRHSRACPGHPGLSPPQPVGGQSHRIGERAHPMACPPSFQI
jgi:hypothetical protein